MQISSLICEYNPFHNGHKQMLDIMRANGATHIIACMSGNFTQRGEPAIIDKTRRTFSALQNGVDLVIELDTPHAIACAEKFALGGVMLLDALGCADTLCFGSECGSISLLEKAAQTVLAPEIDTLIPKLLKGGCSYASAHHCAVTEIAGEQIADILKEPNNILAVEYIKALYACGSSIKPQTIKRIGTAHDSEKTTDNIASASHIRNLIINGNTDYRHFVPSEVGNMIRDTVAKKECPNTILNLERTLIYKLRSMSVDEIRLLPDVSEGLEHRIYAAASACSYDELLTGIKSKRYTLARIRRILLCALLGITDKDVEEPPVYIRVLGLNRRGRDILKLAQKKSELPVYTRRSDISKTNSRIQYRIKQEDYYNDIYALAFPAIQPSGNNARTSAVYLDVE